jgi:hypothetical protein
MVVLNTTSGICEDDTTVEELVVDPVPAHTRTTVGMVSRGSEGKDKGF